MKKALIILSLLFLCSCEGFNRGCSSDMASSFGADWLVVQYDMNGKPFHCWALTNTSIANEPTSDGIYWLEPSGNLVHISGWYNRVQVNNHAWNRAAKSVGVVKEGCARGGMYNPPVEE